MLGLSAENSPIDLSLQISENPRAVFKTEMRPLITLRKELTAFQRVLRNYQDSLLPAVLHQDMDRDLVNAAFVLVGHKRITKEEKDRLGDEGAQRKIIDWFTLLSPNSRHQLSKLVTNDPETQQQLDNLIAENLAHCLANQRSLGRNKQAREKTISREVSKMGNFLLQHSPGTKHLGKDAGIFDQQTIGVMGTENETCLAVLEIIDGVPAFKLREWIAENAQGARGGRRIYDTPYYNDLLDKIHFIGRKKNGIGGVILYGPPGVGKTELLQEKNNREGFEDKTRVVSIHHYISSAELLGERAIRLSGDFAGSLGQGIEVIKYFKDLPAEKFKKVIETAFENIKSEGKIDSSESLERFLIACVDLKNPAVMDIITRGNLSLDDWAKIQEAYITKHEARLFRSTLPQKYQEDVTDFIVGEMIYAMTVTKERIVLDEVDKAGPNAMGGVLGFLAKSPGDKLKLGSTTSEIEDWFRVDATSNSTVLNEYFTSRFSSLEVSTPPAKDQLMIASVRLSDVDGNILLDSFEQRQLGAFFVYVIPEINAVFLKASGQDVYYPPLGNREIQELCSYLVDFNNQTRTEVSFNQAVRMLFLQNKIWSADPTIVTGIQQVMTRFGLILADEPHYLSYEDEARPTAQLSRPQLYTQTLENIQKSPLIKIINGLTEQPDEIEKPKIRLVSLTSKQQQRIKKRVGKRPENLSPVNIPLPIGFRLHRDWDKEGQSSDLEIIDVDGEIHTLLSQSFGNEGQLHTASSDGKKVVTLTERGRYKDIKIVRPFSLFDKKGSDEEMGVQSLTTTHSQQFQVKTDKFINYVGVLEKREGEKSGHLEVFHPADTVELYTTIPGVGEFAFSENGSLLLVRKYDGTTFLYNLNTNNHLAYLPGSGWAFASDKLLVRQQPNEDIDPKAYLIT